MIFSSSSFLLKVFVGFTSINWMLLICFNALLATHSIWKWPQKYHQLRILSSQEGIEYNVAHYGRNETFMSMFRYCITDDFFKCWCAVNGCFHEESCKVVSFFFFIFNRSSYFSAFHSKDTSFWRLSQFHVFFHEHYAT